MIRVLGVDPGAQITGYGIIDSDGRSSRLVAFGSIRLVGAALPDRLGKILHELKALIDMHAPNQVAIEEVFVARNARSALVLGHARGAALCAAGQAGLPVSEYATRAVKLAVVGYGAADKRQVQHMVSRLLGIRASLGADAADALAIALCHAHTQLTAASRQRLTEALAR